MPNDTLPRNATRVVVHPHHLEGRTMAEAVALAVLDASGDHENSSAGFLLKGFGENTAEDRVILRQPHAAWWAWLPQELVNLIDLDLFWPCNPEDRAAALGAAKLGLLGFGLTWHEGEAS